MNNEDYPSEVDELLKDLNSVLTCIDYDFDYYNIIKKYGCKTYKEFVGYALKVMEQQEIRNKKKTVKDKKNGK